MTAISCRVGKLCLRTEDAGSQATANSTVKTTATDRAEIMSARAHVRFHKYVVITPDCWLWKGSFSTHFGKATYGQMMVAGERMGAHRASYILHVGPVPDGLDVLHSCDVKACVNPAHLRPGTHTENIREAFAKLPADYFKGENASHKTLTWEQVHAIRAAAANGARPTDLARKYGVAQPNISAIVHGRRWDERYCPVHGVSAAEVA